MHRLTRGLVLLAFTYFVLTLMVSALLPLRLAELNQALISLNFSWTTMMTGIAAIPGASPLGYLIQLPFALLAHHSRVLLRLPSVLSATANCYLMWRLAKLTPVKTPLAAAIVFLFIPIQFEAACDSRPYELALFFLLLAMSRMFKVLESPNYRNSVTYALLLALCIYTEPFSYLPVAGYVLFLLRFSGRPAERRALWFILPSTVLPALAFMPFYAWSSPLRSIRLLFEKLPLADTSLSNQALHSLAPGTLLTGTGVILLSLLVVGACVSLSSSFPPFLWPWNMRINLFCLAGGSIITLVFDICFAYSYHFPLTPQQMLFALPGLVILTFAALDWLVKSRPEFRTLACYSAAAVLVVLSVPSIYDFVISPGHDLAELVQTSRNVLTPDSCIVFVSEGESPYLFLLYDSDVWKQECHDFSSKRVVLASHPWVTPDEQRDSESFFRGLNFTETQRIKLSGGLVLVEEAR